MNARVGLQFKAQYWFVVFATGSLENLCTWLAIALEDLLEIYFAI